MAKGVHVLENCRVRARFHPAPQAYTCIGKDLGRLNIGSLHTARIEVSNRGCMHSVEFTFESTQFPDVQPADPIT
jgi:hypothetical protein